MSWVLNIRDFKHLFEISEAIGVNAGTAADSHILINRVCEQYLV
jgi:hypothetical protein